MTDTSQKREDLEARRALWGGEGRSQNRLWFLNASEPAKKPKPASGFTIVAAFRETKFRRCT